MSTLKKYLAISALSLTIFSQNMRGQYRPAQPPIQVPSLPSPAPTMYQPSMQAPSNETARLTAAIEELNKNMTTLIAGQNKMLENTTKIAKSTEHVSEIIKQGFKRLFEELEEIQVRQTEGFKHLR